MTSIAGAVTSGLNLQAIRSQFQQDAFSRLSGGEAGIGPTQWQQALQNLPGAANRAGVVGTGTASAIDAAFRSMDANKDGQLSASEFSTALDTMLERARQRPRHGTGDTPLDAQLLGQQQAASGGPAPDFLRRMLLGYAAQAG